MASLGRKFLSINNELLPETSNFDIDIEVVEKEFQTENGHDVSILIRGGKHVFSVAWEGAEYWLKEKAEAYALLNTVSVVFDATTYVCRVRSIKTNLVKYSNRWEKDKGLWNVSFQLKEI